MCRSAASNQAPGVEFSGRLRLDSQPCLQQRQLLQLGAKIQSLQLLQPGTKIRRQLPQLGTNQPGTKIRRQLRRQQIRRHLRQHRAVS